MQYQLIFKIFNGTRMSFIYVLISDLCMIFTCLDMWLCYLSGWKCSCSHECEVPRSYTCYYCHLEVQSKWQMFLRIGAGRQELRSFVVGFDELDTSCSYVYSLMSCIMKFFKYTQGSLLKGVAFSSTWKGRWNWTNLWGHYIKRFCLARHVYIEKSTYE
jgi:hypothetical protein